MAIVGGGKPDGTCVNCGITPPQNCLDLALGFLPAIVTLTITKVNMPDPIPWGVVGQAFIFNRTPLGLWNFQSSNISYPGRRWTDVTPFFWCSIPGNPNNFGLSGLSTFTPVFGVPVFPVNIKYSPAFTMDYKGWQLPNLGRILHGGSGETWDLQLTF
jgi:hypothetical protein